MKKIPVLLLPVLCAVLLFAAQPKFPTMPAPVSGNAVASLKGGLELYSLMGIGNKRTWDDITSRVYSFHLSGAKWMEVRPVPGVAGRLGASAIGVRGQIFVFGGFVVDGHGAEMTVPDVNSYVADEHRWYRAADMPVPVDSAVIGEDRDRYIYLVGGKSKNGPVNNVQVYDAVKNTWSEATPFPGSPVFGLAGGVADEAIVFVDGAKKNSGAGAPYVASDECWIGKIDKKDPNKIEWSKLPSHPGSARFGIVAGARNGKVLFSGGSPSVHNYKGLDAEGKPVDISTVTFGFDVRGNKWETIDEETYDARTDSRGILSTPVGPVILGGIVSSQAPTARVLLLGRK
jgi:N-acetylneuraminic acid mutarotase